MRATGATAKIQWIDESFHPEMEVESHLVDIKFYYDGSDSEEDNTFYSFEDADALKDYSECPDGEFAILDYDLVF
jgi:hypothetical protein